MIILGIFLENEMNLGTTAKDKTEFWDLFDQTFVMFFELGLLNYFFWNECFYCFKKKKKKKKSAIQFPALLYIST